jgi:site-specific DNA-adenine methylase
MAYPGGKAGDGVYQKIINQMPPHRVYIEAFLGGGAVMLKKRPAISSIGIDVDTAVTQEFRADIPGLELWNTDAMQWLKTYDFRGDELVYADPPYLMSTRSCQRDYYAHEFASEEEHALLLAVLKSLPCYVMLSGYWSDLYARELRDWRHISYLSRTRGSRTAREFLWMNFPEPFELHDYQYLGENFRERERIKRKKDRWAARLASMPALERYAILDVIDQASSHHQK